MELQLANANYKYTIKEEADQKKAVYIEEFSGNKVELYVPEMIEDIPVVGIEKKAFFNVRGMRRLYLPKTLKEIGDWAFSHCNDLEEVYLPKKYYEMGRGIFSDCTRLKNICLWVDENEKDNYKGYGSLLCATTGVLSAPYLFQTETINDAEWLSLWDKAMLTILQEDDMEGYTKLLLCGEEDYGSEENDLGYFLTEKRKRKVRLAFLRLLYPKGLSEEHKKFLEDYLINHTVGCESVESFLVLKEEHGDEPEYIQLFFDLGCVTKDNFDMLLEMVGENHPQLKAYLLRFKEEKLGSNDFFDSLSLDGI